MATTYIVEKYLNSMKGKEVKIFVVNGFQMTGILEAFDEKAIQLRETRNRTPKKKLIFYSGITTVEEVT